MNRRLTMLEVWNETRSCILGNHVEVADTLFRRARGLLGRQGLNAGSGIWINPSSGVHTICMQFPIDVIGLDKHLRVVCVRSHVKPNRIAAVNWRVRSILEFAAGAAHAAETHIGDVLVFREIKG